MAWTTASTRCLPRPLKILPLISEFTNMLWCHQSYIYIYTLFSSRHQKRSSPVCCRLNYYRASQHFGAQQLLVEASCGCPNVCINIRCDSRCRYRRTAFSVAKKSYHALWKWNAFFHMTEEEEYRECLAPHVLGNRSTAGCVLYNESHTIPGIGTMVVCLDHPDFTGQSTSATILQSLFQWLKPAGRIVVQAFDTDAAIREGWMQRERRHREWIATTDSRLEQINGIERQADLLIRKLGLPAHVLSSVLHS
jgi:hypothetical protein